MSAQQLVSVMGKNTQVNPMLMKNDMSFVQSLYDTGVAPLQGPITNKNKDMFQNQERIQSMIDLNEYIKVKFLEVSGTSPQNVTVEPGDYQLVITNTNLPTGTDITITVNNIQPINGSDCIVFASQTSTVYFVNNQVLCFI
jgi:hypothetical protein